MTRPLPMGATVTYTTPAGPVRAREVKYGDTLPPEVLATLTPGQRAVAGCWSWYVVDGRREVGEIDFEAEPRATQPCAEQITLF